MTFGKIDPSQQTLSMNLVIVGRAQTKSHEEGVSRVLDFHVVAHTNMSSGFWAVSVEQAESFSAHISYSLSTFDFEGRMLDTETESPS